MEQLQNYGDARQTAGCVHCGGIPDTRDHVPSKIFLDEPYPENLPVVGACQICNQRLSLDEEYLACLIECARVGDAMPSAVEREKVRRILMKKPALTSKLAQARVVGAEGNISFNAEIERAGKVLLKLARGHALFELNEPHLAEPERFGVIPLHCLSDNDLRVFEEPPGSPISIWPEVGSRAMQRMLIADDDVFNGWIVVQPGRYRYLAYVDSAVTVRMVLSEYLACEVVWEE